jgi:membrane protease YdiL (CAAX protease family)
VTDDASHRRSTPRATSLLLFIALAGIAVFAMVMSAGFFPGSRGVALTARLFCWIAVDLLLIAGSRHLLRRDRLAADRLGLVPSASHLRAFVFGTAMALALILVLLGAFYLITPFELSAGPWPTSTVVISGLNYLVGNFGEELLFRGYLLIAITQWLGATRALWLLALPFGLFHFPGLDGLAVLKMVLTTGAMHFVFAYAYLATRSLWAAVALHAVSNTLLHSVLGVGEPAALSMRFLHDPPRGFDTPFLILFGTACAFGVLLSRLPRTRSGLVWLAAAGTPVSFESRKSANWSLS